MKEHYEQSDLFDSRKNHIPFHVVILDYAGEYAVMKWYSSECRYELIAAKRRIEQAIACYDLRVKLYLGQVGLAQESLVAA